MGVWAPKQLNGDTTCAIRVHSDGYVMWHRADCDFGGKEHGLSLGEVGGLPHETFLAALDREGTEDGRTVLFCGACLVYEPKAETSGSGRAKACGLARLRPGRHQDGLVDRVGHPPQVLAAHSIVTP